MANVWLWIRKRPRAVLALAGLLLLSMGSACVDWRLGLIVPGGVLLFDALRQERGNRT